MTPFRLFRKAWEKELCSYVLQEYGATGGRGWANITEAVEESIGKLSATEFFKPGKHYRVIARYTEGNHAGQFAGVVWQHYEPVKGIKAVKGEEEEKTKKKEKETHDPVEAMAAYADKLEADLQPIVKLQNVIRDFQETFMPTPAQPALSTPSGEEGEEFKIPPPEFDGKLPVYMHPFVVKTIFGELNAFVDHAADRFGGMFGGGGPAGKGKTQAKAEEEEEPLLPSIRDFALKPIIKGEQEPIEFETEEEEEVTLPMPKEKVSGGPVAEFKVQPPEETEEESKAETVPSLFPDEEPKYEDTALPGIDEKFKMIKKEKKNE